MRNVWGLLFIVLLVGGCRDSNSDIATKLIVLNYSDFGPQIIAKDAIGMEWWQWQDHGEARPQDYKIKVVVYRGVERPQVAAKYPVVSERQQDYRYLTYADAMAYLDRNIADDILPVVTATLKNTRALIVARLGSP